MLEQKNRDLEQLRAAVAAREQEQAALREEVERSRASLAELQRKVPL